MSSFLMPDRALLTPRGVHEVKEKAVFTEENEWKVKAFEALGDLDDIILFYNDVIVLKYIRTQLSDTLLAAVETQREDKWQNSVGLVLKVGPRAFIDDDNTKFYGVKAQRGDWVLFRDSDGWNRGIQELYGKHKFASCKFIQDAHIRGIVRYPGRLMAGEW